MTLPFHSCQLEGPFYDCLWSGDKGPWYRSIFSVYHRWPELLHYNYCFVQWGEVFTVKRNEQTHTHTHTHTHALVLTLKDFKNISIKDAHKNSQKLLKNLSVGVSFLIKLHQIYNFIKTGLWHWCFPVNFEKILIPLFRTPLVAASVFLVNPLPHKGQLYQSFQICEDHLCTLFLKKCFCHTFINETGTLISRESFTLNR